MAAEFRRVFSRRHVVLPVVHVESEQQARRNTDLARQAGADGVFLINHFSDCEDLLAIHRKVCEDHPDWWVGVNCLDLDPPQVFKAVTDRVAGIWVDNAGIDEREAEQPLAEEAAAACERSSWEGLYFGGVAFKYQRPVEDLTRAARLAVRFMDVVTTSGPGTGIAAACEKIAAMKEAVGDFPLAIASGITPDNVADYLDVADCFLVATGISRSFTELDPDKVRELIERVNA
ncbi:MAG: BtpA/SgcQ family protein [Gemmatimonadales bacterium]|jgi:predicted TIM-barrel enzyme